LSRPSTPATYATQTTKIVSLPPAYRAEAIAGIAPEAKEAAVAAGLDSNQSALLKIAAAPKQEQGVSLKLCCRPSLATRTGRVGSRRGSGSPGGARGENSRPPCPADDDKIQFVGDIATRQLACPQTWLAPRERQRYPSTPTASYPNTTLEALALKMPPGLFFVEGVLSPCRRALWPAPAYRRRRVTLSWPSPLVPNLARTP
jgi:hypothetical protein